MAHLHSIFFVDDNERIRKAAVKILSESGCEVICFAKPEDCLKQINSRRCDLLIMDVKLPCPDGMTSLYNIKRTVPHIPLMVISTSGDAAAAVSAMKMGAVDFMKKPLNRDDFLTKVKAILEQNNVDVSSAADLTRAERPILQLIIKGKSNKEIAHILHRSIRTIEMHRGNIMQKLGVDNAVDLTKKAILMRLVSMETSDGR